MYQKNLASNYKSRYTIKPNKTKDMCIMYQRGYQCNFIYLKSWFIITIGHLPPITKTIQVRRTRHAGHCWRSRDELIRDVLLWTPTHGRAKAGRPARTYIQQLCEDMGCCPEDLPRAMNDREEWRERVRDIRATSVTWWWNSYKHGDRWYTWFWQNNKWMLVSQFFY